MTLRLKERARRLEAVGKMNLAWGRRSWNVWLEEGEGRRVARSGGAKEKALEPRPWRRIRVCFWGRRRGSMISAPGYVEDFFLLLWEGVVKDAMVDGEVERCGVRELELCHILVSLLSSSVVSLK